MRCVILSACPVSPELKRLLRPLSVATLRLDPWGHALRQTRLAIVTR